VKSIKKENADNIFWPSLKGSVWFGSSIHLFLEEIQGLSPLGFRVTERNFFICHRMFYTHTNTHAYYRHTCKYTSVHTHSHNSLCCVTLF